VLAKKSPPVVKSVARWIVRLPTMAIWVAPVGLATSVTLPVPKVKAYGPVPLAAYTTRRVTLEIGMAIAQSFLIKLYG